MSRNIAYTYRFSRSHDFPLQSTWTLFKDDEELRSQFVKEFLISSRINVVKPSLAFSALRNLVVAPSAS